MTLGIRRFLPLSFPVLLAAGAVAAACGDDDDDLPTVAPDAAAPDGATQDGAVSGPDASPDATSTDAGADVDAAPLPPLCETYPDDMAFDAGTYVGLKRYEVIAYRTYDLLAASCQVAPILENWAEPDLTSCLGLQLLALAGCKTPDGEPVKYAGEVDPSSGLVCFTDGGSPVVSLHLPNPNALPTGISINDADFAIEQIRSAAIASGYSVDAADRLKARLQLERPYVLSHDAGADDAGHPSNACP